MSALCLSCGYWSATNGPLCESCAMVTSRVVALESDAFAARIAALEAENARLRRMVDAEFDRGFNDAPEEQS